MLEVVFPICAIYEMPDIERHENAAALSRLASGEAYHVTGDPWFIAGSRAEGVAMEPWWGHQAADVDFMGLYGAQLGVYLPQGHEIGNHRACEITPSSSNDTRGISCLEYDAEGCLPGYTRLRITNTQALKELHMVDARSVEESAGHHWLNTVSLNEAILRSDFDKNEPDPEYKTTGISGPAGQVSKLNTLRPRQDGRHFPDDILKCIFLTENLWNSLTVSLKCVRKIRINNIPSLVQIIAWHRPGDKPLSEPMIVILLTHICVPRPQWVNWQTVRVYKHSHQLHIISQ